MRIRRMWLSWVVILDYWLNLQLINPKVEIIMVENTPDDPRQRKPDITKAKEVLGWEPKVKLREGLPLMEEDFRLRLGVPKNWYPFTVQIMLAASGSVFPVTSNGILVLTPCFPPDFFILYIIIENKWDELVFHMLSSYHYISSGISFSG